MKYLLLILYIGLLLLIFFGLPDSILYSRDILRWIPFILIVIVQTYLLYRLLKSFKVKPMYLLAICAVSVLVIGPSFAFYLEYQDEKDFQRKGKSVKGVVYKKWYAIGKNSEWLLRCEYIVNGIRYSTFSETDEDNSYKIGDTLTIVYFEDYPPKYKIIELD